MAGTGGMHGREPEQRIIRDLLRRAAQGVGGVALVQGEQGIGKSLLLGEAADEAAGQGFSLAVGVADQLGQAIPFFALRAALGEPFARFMADRLAQNADGTPAWWIRQMQAHLEQRAASAPVLICVDDVHWASPATLAALRTLPGALNRCPVTWVLARSSVPHHDTEYLFDVLEKDGAARISMAPLAEDAIAALLADAFGAPPDDSLAALAAGAAGNPSLLVELIAGLRDEDAVRLTDGHAALVSGRLPRRMHQVARQRLSALSKQAQHLLVTAAVLGPSFRLEDAAELVGKPPAALLPVVEETMAAGIMATAESAFSFRHQLLRRAVRDMIPQPGRKALHRQYGRMLLGRGESAARAAGHLLQAAHSGDQRSLADLDSAVAQLSSSAPWTAADLALRALELTSAASVAALPRAIAAAEALAAAGRLDQAARIAQDTLAKPLPPAAEARLRCALSSVLCSRGQARDAAAEAAVALAQPQLWPGLRDQAVAARLRALAESHDELAGSAAVAVLADPGQRDSHVVAAALAARAVTRWDEGQIGEALTLMRDAARNDTGISRDARYGQPLLTLTAALIEAGQLGEAEEILHAADSQVTNGTLAQAMLMTLRARFHLASGRVADADAAAREALEMAANLGAQGCAATAHRVLGLVALRRGDVVATAHHLAGETETIPPFASAYSRSRAALAQARVCEVRGDVAAAVGHIREVSAGLASYRGLLLGGSAAWLVRTALAADEVQLAATIVRAAETLAAENPGYPAIAAMAAHSLGLAGQDPARLAEAAGQYPDPWARASAAEDLGALHAQQADQLRAIRHLTQALEGYASAEATADMARVRSRLRKLGVRRRHWAQSAGRPVTGWESLTAAEQQVSELAAQGLNNRQIAGRLYVSVSTVAFYLRQIFRKLDISSRVELARLVILRSSSPPLPAVDATIPPARAASR